MGIQGQAKILKIYLNEDARYKGHSLYHALVAKFAEQGLAGATVTRGIEGFGHDRNFHSSRILDISLKLPVIVEVIDNEERITQVLPIVKEMVSEGLVILADVTVL